MFEYSATIRFSHLIFNFNRISLADYCRPYFGKKFIYGVPIRDHETVFHFLLTIHVGLKMFDAA